MPSVNTPRILEWFLEFWKICSPLALDIQNARQNDVYNRVEVIKIFQNNTVGRDSSVGIATSYELDSPRI